MWLPDGMQQLYTDRLYSSVTASYYGQIALLTWLLLLFVLFLAVLRPGYGWDAATSTAFICPDGFYSTGFTLQQCKACSPMPARDQMMWTTTSTPASSYNQCGKCGADASGPRVVKRSSCRPSSSENHLCFDPLCRTYPVFILL